MRHYLSSSNNPDAVKKAYEWIEEALRPVGGVITTGGGSCHSSIATGCLDRSGLLDHSMETILITDAVDYDRTWPHYPSGVECLYVCHPYMSRLEREGGLDKIIQDISPRLEDENISLLAINSEYSWYYPGSSTTIIYGDTGLFDTLLACGVFRDAEKTRFWEFEAGPSSSYTLRNQFIEDLGKSRGYYPHLSSNEEERPPRDQEEEDMQQEMVDATIRLADMISRSYGGYNAWKDVAKRGDTQWAITCIIDSITCAKAYEGFDPIDLINRAGAIHHHLLKRVENDGWDFPDKYCDDGLYDPKFLQSPFGRR